MNHHETLEIFKTILFYTRLIHAVDWMPTVLSAAGGTAGNCMVQVVKKKHVLIFVIRNNVSKPKSVFKI